MNTSRLEVTLRKACVAISYGVDELIPADIAIGLKNELEAAIAEQKDPISHYARGYTDAMHRVEQAKPQEPVAWTHVCNALCVNDLELWVNSCPHCGKPRTHPQAQEDAYGMCVNGCARQCDFCLKHYGKA